MSLLILIAACIAAAAASAHQASFSFSLLRIPAGIPHLGQALDNIALINSQQYTYVVQVGLGEGENNIANEKRARENAGKQFFNVVLDTGSSDLWLVSQACQESDCVAVPRFSPDRSDTLTQTGLPFTLEYLTGSVHGQVAFDTVSLGPYQIATQAFAMVSQTADLGLASTATSGILGLCFPAVAAIPTTVGAPLLVNLMSAFEPPQRFFAFHLGRMSGSSDPNASFTIGTIDSALAPDPTRIVNSPVMLTGHSYDYWKLPLERLTVDGEPFLISSSRVSGASTPCAVLDTGTTLLLGPTADVDAFYALLGSAARKDPVAGYQIRCTRAVLLGVVLGSPAREYLLHPADVGWAEGAAGGWCTGGMQANDNVNSGDWLFGDVFLRNVYALHYMTDPPMIGLLSLTDVDAAMEDFRAERGPDMEDDGGGVDGKDGGNVLPLVEDGDDGWDTVTGYVKRWEQHPSGAVAQVSGAVAGGLGFVVGGIGAAGWRFWRGV
ncbi:aspartic peptidase domain-containing protein [Mycena capillaripes]|nr:aspartic peptidase domain-containing protein [Mycena capillaripes]